MTFFMILMLIVGVFVATVVALLGISYVLGLHLYSRECTQVARTGADPCAQCDTDRDWFQGLPLWKQNMVSAWWWANRIRCGAKGCK
jgi:hypothetical protein